MKSESSHSSNCGFRIPSPQQEHTEGDAVVQKLLAVERYDDPTEIVIHVNMLKEGWDVTNLYTSCRCARQMHER